MKLLSASLFGAGVFMTLFGLRENIWLIGFSGFSLLRHAPVCQRQPRFSDSVLIWTTELQGRGGG